MPFRSMLRATQRLSHRDKQRFKIIVPEIIWARIRKERPPAMSRKKVHLRERLQSHIKTTAKKTVRTDE